MHTNEDVCVNPAVPLAPRCGSDPAGSRIARGTLDLDAASIDDMGSAERIRDSSGPPACEALELANLPDAAFMIGIDGCIEDMNAQAESLVGFELAELVGRPLDTVIQNRDVVTTGADYTEARDGDARYLPEDRGTVVYHRTGRAIPVGLLLCRHHRGGVLAIMRRARNGLRHEDLAEIVHDVKHPLATISLESHLLESRLVDLGRTSLCTAVKRIARSVEFLDRLIHDLLDVCAIEAGHFVLQREPKELHELVEHAIEHIVATRDRDRVLFYSHDQAIIDVDDSRIERVIANLIQNALKCTPLTSIVLVTLEREPPYARVSVIDSGLARDGDGLGLHVSKQVIEAHGGRFGVESLHGKGSRFFFELPLSRPA